MSTMPLTADAPLSPRSGASSPRARSGSAIERLLTRLAAGRILTVSVLIHAFLVLFGGGVVLFRALPERPDFIAGSEGGLVTEDSTPTAPAASSAPQMQEFTPPTPTMAPALSAITVNTPQPATFTVASVPSVSPSMSDSVKSAMSSMNSGRPGLSGSGAGLGTGRLGGTMSMSSLTFFGMKTKAKRIAFLVDYSGSMEGQFRQEMEQELEKSLKGLPAGTEVLIIPWAGGAWLYNQLATDIARKWQKIDTYDNFAVRQGETLTPPDWVPITPDNIQKLMKGVQAQKAWSGGTDWRSPFNYAMEAKPSPDTIFFLTDGQIENIPRAMEAIDKALKKASPPPTVFALWINNKTYKGDTMKTLAAKYKGEYREIGGKAK